MCILYYIIVLVFLMIIFQSSFLIFFLYNCRTSPMHTHNTYNTYPLISLETRKRMLGYYNEDFHLHVTTHTVDKHVRFSYLILYFIIPYTYFPNIIMSVSTHMYMIRSYLNPKQTKHKNRQNPFVCHLYCIYL